MIVGFILALALMIFLVETGWYSSGKAMFLSFVAILAGVWEYVVPFLTGG